MEKITEIATTLINGNISDFRGEVKDLTHQELINLIMEYSLLSGESLELSLKYFHRIL